MIELVVGIARKKLFPISEPWQRSRLLAQRMDDVTIVHHMLVWSEPASHARQFHQESPAEKEFDMLLEQPCPQAMSDQPRRDGIEDPAQCEASTAGDMDDLVFALGLTLIGKRLQALPLDADLP